MCQDICNFCLFNADLNERTLRWTFLSHEFRATYNETKFNSKIVLFIIKTNINSECIILGMESHLPPASPRINNYVVMHNLLKRIQFTIQKKLN